MIRKTLTLVLAAAVIGTASVSAATWNVDAVHSSIGFKVRHMVVAKVSGNFDEFEGTVDFDGSDPAGGSAMFTIQTASVDTDNEKRDDHLKSPDFFDVEKYPTITFKSTKVIPGDGGEFQLIGDMTMKDVTKEVTFDCEFYGSMNDPWGNKRAGFSAKTTINRQDFNVAFSKTIETGGLVVGNDVEIALELEAVSPIESDS